MICSKNCMLQWKNICPWGTVLYDSNTILGFKNREPYPTFQGRQLVNRCLHSMNQHQIRRPPLLPAPPIPPLARASKQKVEGGWTTVKIFISSWRSVQDWRIVHNQQANVLEWDSVRLPLRKVKTFECKMVSDQFFEHNSCFSSY